jgi:hypothetical protein
MLQVENWRIWGCESTDAAWIDHCSFFKKSANTNQVRDLNLKRKSEYHRSWKYASTASTTRAKQKPHSICDPWLWRESNPLLLDAKHGHCRTRKATFSSQKRMNMVTFTVRSMIHTGYSKLCTTSLIGLFLVRVNWHGEENEKAKRPQCYVNNRKWTHITCATSALWIRHGTLYIGFQDSSRTNKGTNVERGHETQKSCPEGHNSDTGSRTASQMTLAKMQSLALPAPHATSEFSGRVCVQWELLWSLINLVDAESKKMQHA